MWTVARHKNTTALQCRRGNDEIGIISRIASFARVGPQVGSPVKDREGYRHDIAVADKLEKGAQGPGGLTRAEPTEDLVQRDCRESETLVLVQVSLRDVQDLLVLGLENLGQNVRIEECLVHGLGQAAGKIGTCLEIPVDGFDLIFRQSVVNPGPIGERLGGTGRGRRSHADHQTLVLLQAGADYVLKRPPVSGVEGYHVDFVARFHDFIIPEAGRNGQECGEGNLPSAPRNGRTGN